jgi:hypothetical protein
MLYGGTGGDHLLSTCCATMLTSSVTSNTFATATELLSNMLMMAASLSVNGPTGAMLGVTSSSVSALEGRGQAAATDSPAAPSNSVLRSQHPSSIRADARCLTHRLRGCLLWLRGTCEAKQSTHQQW